MATDDGAMGRERRAEAQRRLVVVTIAGPQASGKSTLASALGAEMRRQDELVAVVEFDQVAAMALPTLPSWPAAHRIFAEVTALWARSGMTCVIAEGSGSHEEVSELRRRVPAGAAVLSVVTTSPFDVAYSRARADSTRGVSRDRGFLTGVYERWTHELPRIDADVAIDTSATTVDEGIERILAAVVSARAAEPPLPVSATSLG